MKRKRKNPNKVQLTKADLTKAQKRIDAKIAKMKAESSMDATVTIQALFFYTLKNSFNFTIDDIIRLQEETDRISWRIADPADPFGFDEINSDLETIGIYVVEEKQ